MKKSILALMAVVALAPAAALAQQQEPVRVGGQVKAPERVRYVPPVYPEGAQQARVSGIVILEAVVSPSGGVADVKILKSIPLLDEAAIDAVRQWAYTPTTLNGVPVPVMMTVTVNFTLTEANTSSTPMQMSGSTTGMSSASPAGTAPEWNGQPAIRIGGAITPPERVKYVAPVYPQAAQDARVTGIIILEGIIDPEGNVVSAKVLKSIPLLDQAAIDALMAWKYTPTLLNGVAVPVVMTVTVNFSLTTR